MHIDLLRADITSLKVDAMVNESAPGVMPVGQATVTTGGNLLCRFVIHASVPVAGENGGESKLRTATLSALERAEELAISSVGLPMMASTALPVEEVARVMIQAALDFRSRARSLQRIVFCLFGAEIYGVFERVLEELTQ